MAAKKNTIHGKVLEPVSGKGLSNHRIEVWPENAASTKPIGTAFSNVDGEFQIKIDPKNLPKPAKGDTPNVYFKIFAGRRLYKDTKDSFTWNIDQKEEVNIEMEGPKVIAANADRIDTAQVLKAASFLNESDFTGVYDDFRKRASTSLGVISDMVMNSLTEMDFAPVRVNGPKMEEIVNRDVKQVKKNLSDHNIIVEEVKPYNPRLNTDSIRNIGDFTNTIKPGQRVHLFEENGKVRSYMILREDTVKKEVDNKQKNNELENFDRIKQELNQAKKAAEEKDQQISKLQEEIKEIKKDQSFIKTMLSSDAFGQFLKNNPATTPGKAAPQPRKKTPPKK
jgi:hypothetical protein